MKKAMNIQLEIKKLDVEILLLEKQMLELRQALHAPRILRDKQRNAFERRLSTLKELGARVEALGMMSADRFASKRSQSGVREARQFSIPVPCRQVRKWDIHRCVAGKLWIEAPEIIQTF